MASVSDSVAMEEEMMEEDEEVATEDAEYLIQYLGFQPSCLVNGIYNGILENLKEAMTTLNKAILDTYKDKISESQLKEVSDTQAKVAVDKLDKLIDKAERYLMGNVFCLPKNFTLPSDRAQLDKPCSEGQMNDLDTRLQEVKDKIIAVKYANSVLREKMSTIDKMQSKLDSTLNYATKCHDKVTVEANTLQMHAENTEKVIETIQEFDSLMLKDT